MNESGNSFQTIKKGSPTKQDFFLGKKVFFVRFQKI